MSSNPATVVASFESPHPKNGGEPAASRHRRIIDAPSGFGIEDLDGFDVPSTIPGAASDHSLFNGEHAGGRTPKPGERVGRYLTESILGRGGMGLVLRARDDILQRSVAIKVILPQYLANDPAAGLRFLREAEIVARLDHPHIIRVLDAGLDAGIAYLTFDYVKGKSFSVLRDETIGDPQRAIDLIVPIVSALSCAHRLGVVHGDLKPTNLLLGEDYAGREHPWVLDFGVSFFSEVDAGLDPTRSHVSGTPGYLAPEWLNRQSVDGRADCFSLGCVIYELLAGKGPFAGLSRLSQTIEAATQAAYPRLEDLRLMPVGLEPLIKRALQAKPEDRYGSASEMGAALLPYASAKIQSHYRTEFL